MSRKKAEFLSAMGKGFELVRVITNAVLEQGGREEHVLALLSDKSMATDIARIILKTAQVAPFSPKQQLLFAKPDSIRLRALEYLETGALTDEEWAEVAINDPVPSIREKAVQMIKSQRQLFYVAGCDITTEEAKHAAVLATLRVTSVVYLKHMILDSRHTAARLTAAYMLVTDDDDGMCHEVLDAMRFEGRPNTETRYEEAIIYAVIVSSLTTDSSDCISAEAWTKYEQAKTIIAEGKNRFKPIDGLGLCHPKLQNLVYRLLD
ncbi:hypothetical protein KKG46_01490 [Patescibacteria group bacterium]|nr:hypothetical protein [Patescibacteria group bacterium]